MRRDSGAGFILVAVLGVTALVAALIGAVSLLVRAAVDGARAGGDELALAGLTRAGIELAGYQLYGLKIPFVTLDGQQIRLDSGAVTLFVTDESVKIDLNGADPALLAGLARAAGLSALPPASFASRVADWRDADDERSRGAPRPPTTRAPASITARRTTLSAPLPTCAGSSASRRGRRRRWRD